jgi:hypothetical protein
VSDDPVKYSKGGNEPAQDEKDQERYKAAPQEATACNNCPDGNSQQCPAANSETYYKQTPNSSQARDYTHPIAFRFDTNNDEIKAAEPKPSREACGIGKIPRYHRVAADGRPLVHAP